MFGLNAHAVTAPLCPRNVRSSVGSSGVGRLVRHRHATEANHRGRRRVVASVARARVRQLGRFSDRLFERAPSSTRVHRGEDGPITWYVGVVRARHFFRDDEDATNTRRSFSFASPPLVSVSQSQSSLSPLSVLSLSLSVSTSSRARLERTVSVATRRLLVVVVASRRVPSSPPRVSPASPRPTSPIASRPRRRPTCVPSFYHRPTVRISRPTPRTASRRRARRRALRRFAVRRRPRRPRRGAGDVEETPVSSTHPRRTRKYCPTFLCPTVRSVGVGAEHAAANASAANVSNLGGDARRVARHAVRFRRAHARAHARHEVPLEPDVIRRVRLRGITFLCLRARVITFLSDVRLRARLRVVTFVSDGFAARRVDDEIPNAREVHLHAEPR